MRDRAYRLYNQSGELSCILGVSMQIRNDQNQEYASQLEEDEIEDIRLNVIDTVQKVLNLSEIAFNKKIKLSKRQAECLHYLKHGKTYKECAYLMGLSPRTIEHYVDDLKNKLNVYSKSQLIEKAFLLNITDHF